MANEVVRAGPALTDPYSTGILSKDFPTEFERLQSLERWSDPATTALIGKFALPPNAHCLEMGAGAGSMAYWLAERCPAGRVVAVDIDPRYLDAGRAPNLEIVRADLSEQDFPPESFDLIHTRLVLSYISKRDEILKRAASWLKPGGAILVEDFYVAPLEGFAYEETKVVFEAIVRAFVAQGNAIHWARRIPHTLAKVGIENIDVRLTPMSIGLGDAANEVWRLGLKQFFPYLLERGFITPEQIAAYGTLPSDAIDIPWLLISTSGRRS